MDNHNISSNVRCDGLKMSMYVAISSQAVRATGGRFNDQDVLTHVVNEVSRVPNTLRGEDMIWAMPKGIEAGVKFRRDNITDPNDSPDLLGGDATGCGGAR